jgi:hypothetical protein
MAHFDLGAVIGYILLVALLGAFVVPVLSLPALLIPARVLIRVELSNSEIRVD